MGRVLVGPRVKLRPLEPSIFEKYLASFSYIVRSYLGADLESERIYLETHYHQMLQGETFFFVILCKEKNIVIGAIEVRHESYRGQLYYWLNERFWSRGFLQEALKILLKYYHAQTGKKSVTAFVDVSNILSIRALERFGFHKEGTLKGARDTQIAMIYFL